MQEHTPSQIRPGTVTAADYVAQWLVDFESALQNRDGAELNRLFDNDCQWRDLLAFTRNITPHAGKSAVVDALLRTQPLIRASNFEIPNDRTWPREIQRVGVEVIEAIFEFTTKAGRCEGVVRLLVEQPDKARGFMTSLNTLHDQPEDTAAQPSNVLTLVPHIKNKNSPERRAGSQAIESRETAVLIGGAGQAGLSLAARLKLMDVDALVVDKLAHVGDV